MAYARWSDEGCNWYIWWDCGGYLACHYIHDKWTNYNYGDDIEEFIKNFPAELSEKDKYDLRCCINAFIEDYEHEEKSNEI